MLVSTLIERINYALRGTDDTAPSEGSQDADYWLETANRKLEEWARDPNESWSSLYAETNIAGTVTSEVQTYNLSSTFMRPASSVWVTTTTNDRIDFNLVNPGLRQPVSNAVYIAGANPKKLTFAEPINADSQANLIGGTITVPGYYMPTALAAFADTVTIDDPNWLVMAVAAQIAFNDVSYEDKFADLNGQANTLYMAMKAANRRGTPTNPRTIPTSVRRIRGTEDYV